MPIDTQWFFELFLGGFITIWAFRYFSADKREYAEFEWFALSAFWGIIMIGLLGSLPDTLQTKTVLANPLETGLVLSFFGMLGGYAGSRIVRMKWFKWLTRFFGKDGEEDKSGKFF